MKQGPCFIKGIQQKDNYTFAIEWNDGIIQNYRLSHLQRNCPCAKCYDAINGKRTVNDEDIKEDLKAESIASVGRYAVRIQFSSGCSKGIYSYSFLREIGAKTYA